MSELKSIDPDTIPYFTFEGKTFQAIPCDIYDGDTFSAIFYYRGEYVKYKCRCYGYDSPEMKPLLSAPNREEIKLAAKASKARLTELLTRNPEKIIQISCLGFEKYGRLLVHVHNLVDTESVNDIMIRENHGKPYFGGKKE